MTRSAREDYDRAIELFATYPGRLYANPTQIELRALWLRLEQDEKPEAYNQYVRAAKFRKMNREAEK